MPRLSRQAAGSSPVVPAILSKGVIGRDTKNSYPQSHPQLLLKASRFESRSIKKLFLRRDHLVELFVRVQVERGLTSVITSKPANEDQVKTGQRDWAGTGLFYSGDSFGGKFVFVRQLRGPHLSTCP